LKQKTALLRIQSKHSKKPPKEGKNMNFSSFKTRISQMPHMVTILVFLWTALARAAGPETQVRNTGDFNKLHFDGAYTVFVEQGQTCSVKIEAEPKLLAKVTTEVKNNNLKVDTKNGGWFCCWGHGREDIKVYITVKDLKSIVIDGSADLAGKGKFVCDTLELSISGSGDINLELETKVLETAISGSGDVKLTGKAQSFSAAIAGSGDIKAFDLISEKCEVSIAGSGDCQVNAVQELEVSIAGSGEVAYKGNPAKVNNSVSGSGEVTKAE
jgi:hypothetical protein